MPLVICCAMLFFHHTIGNFYDYNGDQIFYYCQRVVIGHFFLAEKNPDVSGGFQRFLDDSGSFWRWLNPGPLFESA